jgi:hypothetical protein
MDHLATGSNVFTRQGRKAAVDEPADHGAAKTVRDQERLRRAVVARGREHGECTALLGTEHHRPGNSARSRGLPSFVITPLDPVEELSGLFVGKHHAHITGRNPCRTLRFKFVALAERHTFVEGIIRNTTQALTSDAASTITTPCNRPRRL